MKKQKVRIFAVFIVLIMLFQLLPVTAEEVTKEIVENISFVEDFESDAKAFTKIGACYNIAEAPGREGKALANNYLKGSGTIEKLYKDSLPKGRYTLSFDYYFEDFSSNIQIRLHGKAGNYVVSTITSAGMFRIRRDAEDWIFDGHVDKQLEIKKWHNIKLFADTENKEITVKVDDEQIVRMAMDDMIDEFLGFSIYNLNDGSKEGNLFTDNLKFYKVADSDDDEMSPIYIDVKTADDIIANNFYKDNPPKFNLTYKNRLNKDQNVKLWYRTYTNQDNKLIWTTESSPEEFVIGASESLNKPLEISKEHFDRMNLDIIMEIDGKQYVRTIPYTMSNNTKDMPNNKRVGIANHIAKGRSDPYLTIPLQARAGIGGLRDELVLWMQAETTKGVYNFTEEMDKRLDLVKDNDIFYLHLWANGNGWVYPDPGVSPGEEWLFPTTEEGLEGLSNFMREFVKFADGRVSVIEVWNEFNNMSGPYKLQYKYQAAYHEALYKGVKEGDPNVVVSGFDTDSWGVNIHGEFEGTLKELNGSKPFDAVSLHPYPAQGGTPPERAIVRSLAEDASNILEKNGYDPDVDYYFTELGISDVYLNNPKAKAAHTVRNQAISHIYDVAECVFLYNYHDYMNYWDSHKSEALFGITESYSVSGTEIPYLGKEAYVALAYYNNLMANAEAVSVIDTGRVDEDFAYHFKHRDGEDVLMMGAIDAEIKAFSFDLGCESVVAGDLYGNEKVIYGVDGKYDFTVDANEILYIKGNFPKIEVSEPIFKMSAYELDIPIDYSFSVMADAPKALNAKMTVSSSSGVEVVTKESVFNDGKAELSFKSLSNAADMADVNIEIKDGDKVYYSARIPLTYSSSGILDDAIKWSISDGKFDFWDIQLSVKNVRSDIPISGTYISDNGSSFRIPEIAPGEVRDVSIPIPQIKDRSQLGSLNGEIKFNTGDSIEVVEDNEVVAIPKTDKRPTIDGVFEDGEWNMSPALSIKADTAEYVKGGTAKWGGADDLSYDAYFAYDEDNLYVSARVKDDVFRNVREESGIWDGDSIQILIGFDEKNQGTEYGLALCNGKPICYRFLWEGALAGLADIHHQGLYEDGEVGITRTGLYTYYEASFPWDKIKFDGGSITPGQYIYFSIVANDDDHLTPEPLPSNKNRDLWMEVVNCIASGSKYNYTAVKTLLIP